MTTTTKKKGRKFDAGKPLAGLLLEDFALAMAALAEVATHGADKYDRGDWRHVPNARTRYKDAQARHELELAGGNTHDNDSQLMHRAHMVWNHIALLQQDLEDRRSRIPGHASVFGIQKRQEIDE